MKTISVPGLVRIKPGAMARLGIYLRRAGLCRVVVLASQGLPAAVTAAVRTGFAAEGIEIAAASEAADNRFEDAATAFAALPRKLDAVVGVGGGKALDMAKYLAFLARLPYFAVPTGPAPAES